MLNETVSRFQGDKKKAKILPRIYDACVVSKIFLYQGSMIYIQNTFNTFVLYFCMYLKSATVSRILQYQQLMCQLKF